MTHKYKKHPALHHSQDLKDIIKPLEKLGINYFAQGRVDNEGQFSGFGTHPGFLDEYLEKKLYNYDLHTIDVSQLGKFIIWDSIEVRGEQNLLDKAADAFGVLHTCAIVEEDYTGLNIYHFSTSINSPAMNQVYVANQDLLKLYVQHIKESIQQSPDLKQLHDIKYTLEANEDYVGFNVLDTSKARNEILNDLERKCGLGIKGVHLSKRELACLKLYVQGKTAKEIAEILYLSFRTVQNYLQSIKDKMGASNKAKLILKTLDYLK